MPRDPRYRQPPPFCIQVELAEGCNLYCDFCGLQGIREQKVKNFKFMSVATAESIAAQMAALDWGSRIEFAMHGEPTMNPDAVAVVAAFRAALPRNQLMMTSNGGGLLAAPGPVARLAAFFDAGLNVFAFDAYESVKIKDKIDPLIFSDSGAQLNGLPFDARCYPDEPDYSPHTRRPRGTRLFVRVQDISTASAGTHSTLNNHCGAGAPPEPITARCAKPFRELSVRWDGNVAVCCNDWRGVYKLGNAAAPGGLAAVWHAPAMYAARRYLLRGERAKLKPCDVCNAKSYRVGLLPTLRGNDGRLGAPSDSDAHAARAAERGAPYAAPVRRPWERAP